MKARIALLGAAAGLLLSLGAGTAQADRRDDCWKRIDKAERKLNEAVRKHGWRSRQAENRRDDLRRAQSRCGGFFGRDDGRWNRGRDRDRDDRDGRRWNRGRRDNTWNRGRRNVLPLQWFWSSDHRRHRHTRNGAWCNLRH